MSDLYFDRDGKPMEPGEWSAAFGKGGNAVAKTEVGGVTVSTVWLGLNHNFGDGPPVIFETMVFGDERFDICERYSTEEEAIAGHLTVVEAVREVLA